MFRINKNEKQKPKSKHLQGACNGCKSKKKKCDGRYPVCSTCEQTGTECTIIDLATGRMVRRDYIQQLEELVSDLKQQLSEKKMHDDETGDSHHDQHRISTESNHKRDLEMEVGYITLGAGSESVGYIGDSSAYSIAKAITSTIHYYNKKRPKTHSTTPPDIQRELDQIPFSKPSIGMSNNYLSAYYDNVQTQYPFLDWSSVSLWFQAVVYRDSTSPEHLFFMYMIFAIGSQIYNTHSTTAKLYTKLYYKKALENIGPLVETTTLDTVQAYLMLSVFSQKMPDASSIWQTTGLAIRTAVILGLHRGPFRVNTQDEDEQTLKLRQLKYWIFWCAYGLERINGIVLGRPFGIADIDIDTPLPDDIDSELSVASHVIKIRRIQSSICTFVYKPVQLMDREEDIDATRVQIVLELNDWMSTFPIKLQSSSVFETENWCKISYHNSMLLLLRPVVLEIAHLKGNVNERSLDWFKAFAHSASTICLNYRDLHSKGKLGYTWLAMHCVFVSGLSFLYCVWLDASKQLQVLDLKGKPLLYDTVSASSSILYVFAEKFKNTAMFRDTFERVVRSVMCQLDECIISNPAHPNANTTSSGDSQHTNPAETSTVTSLLNRENIGIEQYLGYESSQSDTFKDHDNNINGLQEGLWEFLDATGDKFLMDIFSDLENNLR